MINYKRNILSIVVSMIFVLSLVVGQPSIIQASVSNSYTISFSSGTGSAATGSTGATYLSAGSYETVSITVTSTLANASVISFYATDIYGTRITDGATVTRNYLVASCGLKSGYTSGRYYYKICGTAYGLSKVSIDVVIR